MSKKNWVFFTLGAIILLVVPISGIPFETQDYKVVLINATAEQVLDLYESSGDVNLFWVRETRAVKGESSILEAQIGVRKLHGEKKVREVLDELGIECYIVTKACQ